MRPTSILRAGAALAVTLLASTAAVHAQATESGFPILRNFRAITTTAGAESQNFGIAIASDNTIVAANLGGVLTYDGAWWRLIEVGKPGSAFSVAAHPDGRIAAGGIDEFGLIESVAGARRYRSLSSMLPPEMRSLGQISSVVATRSGFAFLSDDWLFTWDGRVLRTLMKFESEERPRARVFETESGAYLWVRTGGLYSLDAGISRVPRGELLRGRRVSMVQPHGNGLLLMIRDQGLHILRGDGLTPLPNQDAVKWIQTNRISSSARLSDGRYALGSYYGGLMLLRPDGAVDQIIDTESGLGDDYVTGIAADRDGTLWLALNEGFSRIEVAARLSVFDSRQGLKGSTYALGRHQGELWVGTSAGLFVSRHDAAKGLVFERRDDIARGAWSFLSLPDGLLIATGGGVTFWDGANKYDLDGLTAEIPYLLRRSQHDPGTVWLGLEDGLGVLRQQDGKWVFLGKISGVAGDVRSIVEDQSGSVWVGTSFEGHARVDIEPGAPVASARVQRFPSSDGSETYLYSIAGEILGVRGESILRLDPGTGALTTFEKLSQSHGDLSLLVEDFEGNVWMNPRPPVAAIKSGNGWSEYRIFAAIDAGSVETIFPEQGQVVWLGNERGLIRHQGNLRATGSAPPVPIFSRISSGGDVLFDRPTGDASTALPPRMRRLRVELAPLTHREGMEYSTRVLPLEEEWSPWRTDAFVELTSLPPGEFVLEARTRAPNGETSAVSRWQFSIPAPWYRTWWAILLWLLLAAVAIHLYTRRRSRTARRRAASLEERVAAQTRELQHTVEELQLAQTELEEANRRLEQLSTEDDLTGLANRRQLQQRLIEEWRRLKRTGAPLGLILIDLDHFKLVNDTMGHLEGDRCLRVVSDYLKTFARRPGDLVARYGGEEFAVLLPNADRDGVLLVAEQIRAGIETINWMVPTDPPRRITASAGVAAVIPDRDLDVETFVGQVDRALYAAKREGRNRVVAVPAEPPDDRIAQI